MRGARRRRYGSGGGSAALAAALLLGCAPPAPEAPAPSPGYDLLIRGGRIVDGTGNAWYHGDVAVRGDRIVRVARPGLIPDRVAREVVDASGLVVAPGFLDINGQGDTGLLRDGRALNKIFQGITTEIMGEGSTPAPRTGREEIDPGDTVALRRDREWRRFGGWLEEVAARGTAVNVAAFVGGGTVRRYAMGLEARPPTGAELDTMRAVTARAMEDGALGIATALIYPPGAFSGTDELVELARVAGAHGGIYISHIRSESDRLLHALAEAVEIGRRSGTAVEIFHLKAAGVDNWALEDAAVALIDSARSEGIDVAAAMYPYTAASTSLTACLPPWTQEDGRLLENLADSLARARIASEIAAGPPEDWENWCLLATPEGSVVTGVSSDENRGLQGRSLARIAAERGTSWIDAALDLLIEEEGDVSMVYFAMSEENVRMQLRLPWIKFGTDAGVWDPEEAESMTHPRAYGSYPRILGRYVRDEGVLGLEEAVRKMSWAVADRVGLRDRGQIREGFFADIVVFDPETIAETATFTDPHRLATGVRHLFVNGEAVIRDGEYGGARPGRFLRGPGVATLPSASEAERLGPGLHPDVR